MEISAEDQNAKPSCQLLVGSTLYNEAIAGSIWCFACWEPTGNILQFFGFVVKAEVTSTRVSAEQRASHQYNTGRGCRWQAGAELVGTPSSFQERGLWATFRWELWNVVKPMCHHPQPLLRLCWPLIFRKDRFVIGPSPIRFSSETDVTTALVLNSCFWDFISASVPIVLNSEDKEHRQTGEEGLFFQTFCI